MITVSATSVAPAIDLTGGAFSTSGGTGGTSGKGNGDNAATISGGKLNFGMQRVGSLHSQSIYLHNTGTAPLIIEAVLLNGVVVNGVSVHLNNPQTYTQTTNELAFVHSSGPLSASVALGAAPSSSTFRVVADLCTNAHVAPGAACSVVVQYLPNATGANTARLSIQSNVPTGPMTLELMGAGQAPVSPAAHANSSGSAANSGFVGSVMAAMGSFGAPLGGTCFGVVIVILGVLFIAWRRREDDDESEKEGRASA